MFVAHLGVIAGPSSRHVVSRALHTSRVLLARPASNPFPLPGQSVKGANSKRSPEPKKAKAQPNSNASPKPRLTPQAQAKAKLLPARASQPVSLRSTTPKRTSTRSEPDAAARHAAPSTSHMTLADNIATDSRPDTLATSHSRGPASEVSPAADLGTPKVRAAAKAGAFPPPEASSQPMSATPHSSTLPSSTSQEGSFESGPGPTRPARTSANAEHTLPSSSARSPSPLTIPPSPPPPPPPPPVQRPAHMSSRPMSSPPPSTSTNSPSPRSSAPDPPRQTPTPTSSSPATARPGLDLIDRLKQCESIPQSRWPWHPLVTDENGVQSAERIIFERPNLKASWKATAIFGAGGFVLAATIIGLGTFALKPWFLERALPELSAAWSEGRYFSIPLVFLGKITYFGWIGLISFTLIPAFAYQIYSVYTALATRVTLIRRYTTAKDGARKVEQIIRMRLQDIRTPLGVDYDVSVTTGANEHWQLRSIKSAPGLIELTFPQSGFFFTRKVKPTTRALNFEVEQALFESNEPYVLSLDRLTKVFGPLAPEPSNPGIPLFEFFRATWRPVIRAVAWLIPPPVKRRVGAWWNAP